MSRILIAEDERDIRELVGFTLQLAGHVVSYAANGLEAIQKVRQEMPDLVLMDYRMPVMNGDEAAENIRSEPDLAGIPIIFLTAREQDPFVAGRIANGAHFIPKPFSIDQLNKKVKDVLEEVAMSRQE
jgi:two-component system, OmpR family, alkaline phosphatase synthesis response regulator PhoP